MLKETRPVLPVHAREYPALLSPAENFSSWSAFLLNTFVAMFFPRVLTKQRPPGKATSHEDEEVGTRGAPGHEEGYLVTLCPFLDADARTHEQRTIPTI